MNKTTKEALIAFLLMGIIAFALWLTISFYVQAGKCPQMTRTELFLRWPHSIIGDWVEC